MNRNLENKGEIGGLKIHHSEKNEEKMKQISGFFGKKGQKSGENGKKVGTEIAFI